MRILFAVHTYYPDRNGVQNVTEYLAEDLARDNEVLVITQSKNNYTPCEVYNDVSIIRIEAEQRGFKFFGDTDRYIKTIREYSPDVLVCVCAQSWQFDWLCPVLDSIDCKKVLYTHGFSAYFDYYPIKEDIAGLHLKALHYHGYWKRYYEKAHEYMAKFDSVVYLSEGNSAHKYAEKYNLKNGIIIPNAVSEEYFNYSICDDNERFGENLNLIYVANYDENKNQKSVLKAYYLSGAGNCTLTMIGGQNKDYFDELNALNDELSKDGSVNKAGLYFGLGHEEILKRMKDSDVFLCGSKKEQYPLMLCEAAAMGMAIISTDVGHARELEGCTVVGDYEEMALKIKELSSEGTLLRKNAALLKKYAENNYHVKDKINTFRELLGSLYEG